MLPNISISDEFVKSVSKEDFIQHFADNKYDWPETDIVAYWTRFNPTPKAAPKTEKPKP